ncbi:hypothetical protein GQ44DRAFT_244913 [Phaeosphaeriaceae sp. PMI808]|nr:hypothetical protein GQ44DRAFT_244913 [Phaeosphaeriaceae sp. PMI808]
MTRQICTPGPWHYYLKAPLKLGALCLGCRCARTTNQLFFRNILRRPSTTIPTASGLPRWQAIDKRSKLSQLRKAQTTSCIGNRILRRSPRIKRATIERSDAQTIEQDSREEAIESSRPENELETPKPVHRLNSQRSAHGLAILLKRHYNRHIW